MPKLTMEEFVGQVCSERRLALVIGYSLMLLYTRIIKNALDDAVRTSPERMVIFYGGGSVSLRELLCTD